MLGVGIINYSMKHGDNPAPVFCSPVLDRFPATFETYPRWHHRTFADTEEYESMHNMRFSDVEGPEI